MKYRNLTVDKGYCIDLLVENRVIVELEAVEKMLPLYQAQLITNMKLTGIRLGYLLSFNSAHFKNVIQRMIV